MGPSGVISFHQRFPSGEQPDDFGAPRSAIRRDESGSLALGRGGRSRPLQGGAGLSCTAEVVPRALLCAALATLVSSSACSGERYSRPEGPVPRYEPAPVLPWDAGGPPPSEELGLGAEEAEGAGARAASARAAGSMTAGNRVAGNLIASGSRLPARSTIPAQGAPLDERRDLTNVSDH